MTAGVFSIDPALPRMLTAAEVGQILRVSAKTVRRLPIPSVAVGTGRRPRRVYRPEDVQAWITKRRVA